MLEEHSLKEPFDFGRQLFPGFVKDGVAFYALKTRAYWRDIGCVENYVAANFDCIKNGGRIIGKGCKIAKTAKLEGRVIIGDNCYVSNGCVIKDSVLWSGVRAENGAKINSSVIGNGCSVGEKASIRRNCIVADGCRIAPNAVVLPDTYLRPGQTIE